MDPITDEEDAKYHLGRLYFQKGDYKKAIKIYKEGLTINSQAIILLYEIGLAYSKLKNHKKVCEYWRKLLKIAPHSFLAVDVREEIYGREKSLMHFSRKRLQENSSQSPNSLIEAHETLEKECIKAILEARKKGILSCPRWNGSTTPAAIDRKDMDKSN